MKLPPPKTVLLWTAVPVGLYAAWLALRAGAKVASGVEHASSSLGTWINERAHDANVFSATANALTELVTLDPHATLGGTLYDLLHPSKPKPSLETTAGLPKGVFN